MRIVQEAIANVLKHARARTLRVRAGTTTHAGGEAAAYVMVEDDGAGWSGAAGDGRGLANMRARAGRIGASMAIRSDAGGTAVRLELPLAAAKEERASLGSTRRAMG
jgi:signal transduction histidine kinase